MDKHKKALFRIIVGVSVFLILGFIFIIINIFTGNPVSKIIAKNKIQRYVNDVYFTDSIVNKTYYSFLNGEYFSEVKIGNKTLTLSINFTLNQITDENVINYFQNKFNDDYFMVCESFGDAYLEFPEWIYIYTSVVADDNYSSDFEKLHIQQKLYLLGVKNFDRTITETNSKQKAARISIQFLNELSDEYNFRSIQTLYIDKFGVYEIIIDNKELTIDELLQNTKKRDSSNIGEEEKAFIELLDQ